MKPIKFKQWLPLEGRHVDQTIERPDEIATKAEECMTKGQFHSQCSTTTSLVNLFFVDTDNEVSHFVTLKNDKGIPDAVDRLVERVHSALMVETV